MVRTQFLLRCYVADDDRRIISRSILALTAFFLALWKSPLVQSQTTHYKIKRSSGKALNGLGIWCWKVTSVISRRLNLSTKVMEPWWYWDNLPSNSRLFLHAAPYPQIRFVPMTWEVWKLFENEVWVAGSIYWKNYIMVCIVSTLSSRGLYVPRVGLQNCLCISLVLTQEGFLMTYF